MLERNNWSPNPYSSESKKRNIYIIYIHLQSSTVSPKNCCHTYDKLSKYNPVWLSVGPLRRKSHRTEAGATAGLQWEFFFQSREGNIFTTVPNAEIAGAKHLLPPSLWWRNCQFLVKWVRPIFCKSIAIMYVSHHKGEWNFLFHSRLLAHLAPGSKRINQILSW